MNKMNWLITGGCGFIGTNLVKYLLASFPEAGIRVIDNLSSGTRTGLEEICTCTEEYADSIDGGPDGLTFIHGDIRSPEVCQSSCTGIDAVVHLAASADVALSVDIPRSDFENNVAGTFNMLEGARQNNVSSFVFASSVAALGEAEPPVHERIAPEPVSPYGAAKLAGEAYCSAFYRTFGLKTVSLRFGNVYGPALAHKTDVVTKFISNALNGTPLVIYGDGTQTRDFIHVEDIIHAVMLSVETKQGGEVYQIATNHETTVNDLADFIGKIVREKTGKEVEIQHGSTRKGDLKLSYSDISKARKHLGFQPRIELTEGITKTVDEVLIDRKLRG